MWGRGGEDLGWEGGGRGGVWGVGYHHWLVLWGHLWVEPLLWYSHLGGSVGVWGVGDGLVLGRVYGWRELSVHGWTYCRHPTWGDTTHHPYPRGEDAIRLHGSTHPHRTHVWGGLHGLVGVGGSHPGLVLVGDGVDGGAWGDHSRTTCAWRHRHGRTTHGQDVLWSVCCNPMSGYVHVDRHMCGVDWCTHGWDACAGGDAHGDASWGAAYTHLILRVYLLRWHDHLVCLAWARPTWNYI